MRGKAVISRPRRGQAPSRPLRGSAAPFAPPRPIPAAARPASWKTRSAPAKLLGHGVFSGRTGGAAGARLRLHPSSRGARRRFPTLPRLLTALPVRLRPGPGEPAEAAVPPPCLRGCREEKRRISAAWCRLRRCLGEPQPQRADNVLALL